MQVRDNLKGKLPVTADLCSLKIFSTIGGEAVTLQIETVPSYDAQASFDLSLWAKASIVTAARCFEQKKKSIC